MADFAIEKNVLVLRAPLTDAARPDLAADFLNRLEQLLARPEPAVVLDLTAAGTLTSTEIALVYAAATRAAESGKPLRVRLDRANRRSLRLAGGGDALPIDYV
jgi:hypothetical protein